MTILIGNKLMKYLSILIVTVIAGPELPLGLASHSMVPLGKGQVIIGGYGNRTIQGKIYYVTCAQRKCKVTKMDQELTIPRSSFVAIPIPDDISGCT